MAGRINLPAFLCELVFLPARRSFNEGGPAHRNFHEGEHQ